jgi:hypothetical protein
MSTYLKKLALTSCSVLLLTAASFTAHSSEDKPNVLFIAIDDLKPIIGAYGNTLAKTPHMDKLASQSTVFTKAYAQYPVCGPSRMSLLTGLRPESNGVMNLKTKIREVNPEVLTLPQHFKEQGYQTAAVGKIFDPRNVTSRELDEVESWSLAYQPPINGLKSKDKLAVESIDAPKEKFGDGDINERAKGL